MLLTLSTTRSPATDLGYLLHKNPGRVQSFDLSFGELHARHEPHQIRLLAGWTRRHGGRLERRSANLADRARAMAERFGYAVGLLSVEPDEPEADHRRRWRCSRRGADEIR